MKGSSGTCTQAPAERAGHCPVLRGLCLLSPLEVGFREARGSGANSMTEGTEGGEPGLLLRPARTDGALYWVIRARVRWEAAHPEVFAVETLEAFPPNKGPRPCCVTQLLRSQCICSVAE